MLRKVLLVPVIALLVLSTQGVWALGLGDIQINSALNQPLDAEIRLISARPGDIDTLKVALATGTDFAFAGLDRPFLLTKLRFRVAQKPDGTAYIRVTTRRPVREPFLNFLMEANWANGRLLREYTVLLDPPTFMGRAPAPTPVQVPTAAAPEVTPSPAAAPAVPEDDLFPRIDITIPAVVEEEETPVAGAAPAHRGDTYGPTKRKDTLWSIAERVRPDDSVSIQQMMLALFRANPEAFFDNINALKAGYILRIPDQAAAQSISRQDAIREARLQYELWKQGGRRTVTAAAAPGGEQPPAAVTTHPEVKLVTPGAETAAAAAGTGMDASAQLERLQKELTLTSEALDSREQQGSELQSRVAELESQIQSMQRLLSLKDDDLARLQKQLGDIKQKVGESAPAAPPTVPGTPVKPAPETEETVAKVGDISANPYAVTEAARTAPETMVKPPVKPAPPQPAAQPSPPSSRGFVDTLLGSPTMMGIAAIVILALGGMLWVFNSRRRMGSMEFPESILSGKGGDAAAAEVSAPSEDTSFMSDLASSEAAAPSAVAEVDPLTEADVYIAYKRFAQAEDMLNKALANEPERLDLKLKMMEVHAATENQDAFLEVAEELHANIDDTHSALWDKAVAMGRELCPDSPLFGVTETMEEVPTAEEGETTEFAIPDDFLAPEETPVAEAEPEEAAAPAEEAGALDFELDMDLDVAEETSPEAETPATEEPLSEFDLDLEGLGLEPEPGIPEEAGQTEDATGEEGAGLDFDMDLESAGLEVEAPAGGEPAAAPLEEGAVPEMAPPGEEGVPAGEEEAPLVSDDEVATKLDLANAYLEMGDPEGARSILEEVLNEGNESQRKEAEELLSQI